MKSRTAPLGDICEINPAPPRNLSPNLTCSFVPMEAVDDWSARVLTQIKRTVGDVSKGYTSFAENDVLLAKITPCMENGKCAIARGLVGGIGFGTTEFHVLRVGNQVLPEWLFYFWRFPNTRHRAEAAMTGSAGQKRVPSSFLERMELPLPSLPDQRRIAARLEQADRMRRTRRYALELADAFLPAAFLEMFGDPASNERGFQISAVDELFQPGRDGVKCGPFGSALRNEEYTPSGIPVWTMENIAGGEFSEAGCLYISTAKYAELEAYSVQSGDILISRAGTVGRMAILDTKHSPSIIHSNLVRLSLDPQRCLPIYFTVLMKHYGSAIGRLKRGAEDAYSFMNTGRISELRIPVPPLTLQRRFAALVAEHERLRAMQREALRQAEHLFQTLLHDAFADGAA